MTSLQLGPQEDIELVVNGLPIRGQEPIALFQELVVQLHAVVDLVKEAPEEFRNVEAEGELRGRPQKGGQQRGQGALDLIEEVGDTLVAQAKWQASESQSHIGKIVRK